MVEVATMRENLAAGVFACSRGGDSAGTGRSLRSEPGGSGNLWRDLLRRVTADGRDRPADGAGRQSRDILRLVIGQGLRLTLIGVGVGRSSRAGASRAC